MYRFLFINSFMLYYTVICFRYLAPVVVPPSSSPCPHLQLVLLACDPIPQVGGVTLFVVYVPFAFPHIDILFLFIPLLDNCTVSAGLRFVTVLFCGRFLCKLIFCRFCDVFVLISCN